MQDEANIFQGGPYEVRAAPLLVTESKRVNSLAVNVKYNTYLNIVKWI